MLTEKQIRAKYGAPGATNLTTLALPYRMRIAWDLKASVKSIQCHKLIADPLMAVFSDLLGHYGFAELQRLGIDLFGGCYNFRQMRGGSSWSHHSWGIAVDLDPERNQLSWTHTRAQFAKVEYIPMNDIFYKHGFLGLGREEDRDWMHYEIAT